MNIEKYLERINHKGKTNPNLENLKKLQKNHLYNVPFENLDVLSNKRIILDERKIENKVLNEKRGGYCYELNGLFYFLLKELGYNAKMISARVNNGKGGWGEEFDHLAIIVELDDLWLVDVGFGDNFIEPLLLELDKPQLNLNGWYKLSKYDDEYIVMSKSSDNTVYESEYIFTLKERQWNEFEGMNNYHQTSPESHFTRNKLCSIAVENGRVSLTNAKLTLTNRNDKTISEIKDENDFTEKLWQYFKVKL